MPYTTGGRNISGQLGMPLYGIQGVLPPFTGNSFWVDPVNGSDGNTGGPQDPYATLTQALTVAVSGNNDVIYLNGTYNPTATVAWNKNNTHLVGLDVDVWSAATISVANTAATSGAFSPLVNVTGTNCIFMNITAVSGIAQAATQVCWAEAGGQNAYINCSFNQVGNATAAAQAGNRALTLASTNNLFRDCVIGSDAVVRATNANSTVTFLATSGSSKFINCFFPMWSSVAGNTHVNAAATTMTGTTVFDNCQFANNTQGAGFTSLTVAFSVSSTAGGICLLGATSVSVGATIIASAGPVYVAGATPTATTSNLAVAAT
jgi:hypothetical protein